LKIIKNTIIILLGLGYFLIFGQILRPEISFTPQWINNLESVVNDPDMKDNNFIGFNLNGKFGYINNSGKILFSDNILFGIAIDKLGFISYSRQNNVLVLKDREGMFIDTIETAGYPYFTDDRRFIINYDISGMSEIDVEGSILWKYNFGSSISSVSASESLVFIGTADGRFRLIDLTGEVVFSKDTKESRINIVYGGSISSNNEIILTVTGIEPQLLALWNKSGNEYQIDSSWSLNSDLRRNAVTGFSDDNLYAYLETDEELVLIELKNNNLISIPVTGRVQHLDFPGDSLLLYVLGQDERGYYMIISETDGNVLYRSRLSGNNVMLNNDIDKIILGIDKNIIGYTMGSM
jgi:putative pyrroloquinoline-quinone-binding quinoprotein